jgi:hypothetical protein
MQVEGKGRRKVRMIATLRLIRVIRASDIPRKKCGQPLFPPKIVSETFENVKFDFGSKFSKFLRAQILNFEN